MKRFFLVALCCFLSLNSFGQTRRLSTTRTEASKRPVKVYTTPKPNYDPVIVKLGRIVDIDNGIVYVKITTDYNTDGEGYFYFYSCNLVAQATAMLKFRAELYKDISAMDISEGACEIGDYVYMRYVPKAPLDVLLPL